MDSPLLAFYRGSGRDHSGRRLSDILGWDADRLEHTHDYIQWLFPLTEPSAYNPSAPVLGASDIAAFRSDPGLRARLRQALLVMLDFYGLACEDADPAAVKVHEAEAFAERSRGWLTPGNHNHLRLTRMLKSLALLGLSGHARGLLACLEAIAARSHGVISEATLTHWRRAVAQDGFRASP